MRDAAQAKAALQGMQDAVKAETAAEVAGSTQAATARQKDIVSIQQETQALSQLASAAKQTNTQLAYGGRNTPEQHLSDLAQELNYTTLLNRQKWLGFSSVQQAMSYRQQMYNLALLENRAHFAGYQTADQYLSFLQRETMQTAALSAAIRDRSSAISAETQLLLAHANALQGTHATAGSLGEGLTSVNAFNAALVGLPDTVVTRVALDDSQAMAQLAAYRAALLGLPRSERMDIVSAASRLGGVPLTPQRATVPVTVRPDIDYAAVDKMLSQAVAEARPEAVRSPLAIEAGSPAAGALSAMSDDTEALADSMALLSDKSAVSAEAIERFRDSLTLAAVDARALEQGLSRLSAAEQLLAGPGTSRRGRVRIPTDAERAQGVGQGYALQEIIGALRERQISNAPRGYPLPAPGMRIVAPGQPQENEEDLWGALSKYMQPGGHAAETRVEAGGTQQAEAALDKIAVEMQWLDHEDATPHVELEGGPAAVTQADSLRANLMELSHEDARPGVELEGGLAAVTEAKMLADELAHLDARARWRVGIGFEEIEQARMAAEGLHEELDALPHEVDTVLVVDSEGAADEIRDYSRDIEDIEREVGTRADFEDTEAESGLSQYITRLIAAVQRRYDFYASFNDTEAKAELASWLTRLEIARDQEDRLTGLGMGGASGGGGGGGPPGGIAGDVPDPDESRAWEEIAKAMRDADQAAVDANRGLYDVRAGLGGLADPAAKAAAALKADGDSAVYMGWRIGLLRTQVQLWSGLFGDTHFIGQVALWHILLDGIVEVLALWIPALATAAAGLLAFGAAGYQSFKEIYQQYTSLNTVGHALGTTIAPLTDSFTKLQNAVRPQVYELLGEYLDAAGSSTGTLGRLINETGNYLDKLGAKIALAVEQPGKGLQDFLTAGAKDLALIGRGFDSLGIIIARFIEATAITHIAEDLATVGDFILKIAADIVQIVPAPVLATVLAIHGFLLWGGLAADAVGKVVIGIAGLAGKLPLLNAGASAVARALGATNDQLVNIARSSAEVGTVSEAMGAKATEQDLAQLAVSIRATGQSVEDFVTSAGTTSANRLERFSEGLDDAGRKSVALGIAAGASDAELASMAAGLGGTAEEAEAATTKSGGFMAMLGRLSPLLGNVYVDIGLVVAGLIGLGVYLGMRADDTRKFTTALGQAVQQASLFTVVSTTVSNLAEVTTALGVAQKTGAGNATELAASQADLSGKLGAELGHVADISHAYGVNFVGALSLMNAAGVTTNQLFTTQTSVWAQAVEQIQGLITGYKAMGQQMGAIGEDLNALNLQNSAQVASMGALNTAYDAFTKTVGGAPSAFITMAQGFATFQSDAAVAKASMTGLNAPSLQLQSDFQSNYNNVEAFFDAFRSDQALTGKGNFTQFVKDAVASLIPMAGGSKEAAAQISALAQEAGGPATDNIKTLQKWVGSIKDPLEQMYKASNQAAGAASNLSQDAQRLTNSLQGLLNPAMAQALFNAHGGQKVFSDWADALAKTGPNSKQTAAATKAVATELLAVTGNSKSAKADFVGFAESAGLNSKQADQLWAQATQHITANLGTVRKGLASTATATANLGTPGLWGQVEHQYMAKIDQMREALIGFGHNWEAHWDQMITWFGDTMPKGMETAWNKVYAFFTQSVPHTWSIVYQGFFNNLIGPMQRFFTGTLPGWFNSYASSWQAHWNQAWQFFSGTVWGNLARFFTSILPGWFTSFGNSWQQHWDQGYQAFFNHVWQPMAKFFTGTLPGWFTSYASSWQAHWIQAWQAFDTHVIAPMTNFFTSTVPKWWDNFANFASQTWSKVWTGFEKDVLTPIENFFTATLPNAMWNSLKGGIDHVIAGLNTVIGWINAVTSVVGVHIGTIPTLAHGGGVPMTSGSVPGTGDEDGTHIVAMGGEYMIRKPARMALQAAYGPEFMDQLNQADSWLGAGSRGSAATQQRRPGRYAAGGGILGTIGDWLGDAASAVSGGASAVWNGIAGAAGDVLKYGEKAVFDSMWTVSGAPAEKALEALGTPGDMGASWLQDIHNGVESWMGAQTAKATASAAATAGAAAAGALSGSAGSVQALMKSMAAGRGWTGAQWNALNAVEMAEAGYNLSATNPSSGAYGVAQFIDGAAEYAQYGGSANSAQGQITAMLNYIAQRYGTPAAAWAHEEAYHWYAAGGPVMSAIRAATSNAEQQEAMALGSWLLTKMNPAGSDPTRKAYGAWLVPLAKNKGLTQAQAQNVTAEAKLVAPAYAKAVLGSTPAVWKATPASAAGKAYAAASTALGTHWSTPSATVLADAWNQVGTAAAPAPGQTTAAVSSADTTAYAADAAKLYPDWEGALGPWHDLYTWTVHPSGVSNADWTTWLNNRATIQSRVADATSYIGPLFTDLKSSPQNLTAAMWSHADSSVRRWQAAMDVATLAKSREARFYNPIVSNLGNLEPAIVAAANEWHKVWGTTSTPTPASGTGTSTGTGSTGTGGAGNPGGVGTPGVGSGPGGVQSTMIDLAPLIIGGPKVGNAGNYGFTIASGGNVPTMSDVAGMFTGGMAAGGVVPNLFVPGLSANLSRQLTAATSGQLPRTLSDAAGNRVGLQVDQLTINNPVAEKPSESITRSSNRLAFLGGRGMV